MTAGATPDRGAVGHGDIRHVGAVIFDWGGTITPWHTVHLVEQWHAFARAYHVDDPDLAQALAEAAGAAEDAGWKRGRCNHSSARIEEIIVEAGVVVGDPRTAGALAAYRAFWEPHTWTDPHIKPLWEGLRDRGIRVGVLSNTIWSRDYHRDVFARDGVLDLVDADVYSSETPWVKPSPEIFLYAARQVGVEPAACVYVGDRSYEDVHGPQSVGMRAIWVPHSDIPQDQQVSVEATPDAVAHVLLDVLTIVDSWVGDAAPGSP